MGCLRHKTMEATRAEKSSRCLEVGSENWKHRTENAVIEVVAWNSKVCRRTSAFSRTYLEELVRRRCCDTCVKLPLILQRKKLQEKREKGVSQLAMLRGNQFRNFANSRPNSANAQPHATPLVFSRRPNYFYCPWCINSAITSWTHLYLLTMIFVTIFTVIAIHKTIKDNIDCGRNIEDDTDEALLQVVKDLSFNLDSQHMIKSN